jgi:uncharacterized protein YecE (DUF72 family)
VFYPKGLVQSKELAYASKRFNSIEINGTHYALQLPSSFEKWYDQTPEGFVFSVKSSRFITHIKRLADVEATLPNFMASGVLALREKLGPFLWQLPPNLRFDPERVPAFLAALPRSTCEAAHLAKRHDERLNGKVFLTPGADRPLRHAMEVRHESFKTPAFFELLQRHNVAFVFGDSGGVWPYAEDLTSDFVYARLHGVEKIYSSGYTDEALDFWAARLRCWVAGKPAPDPQLVLPAPTKPVKIEAAFVYFDTDLKVKAPFNAAGLRERLEPPQKKRER